MPKPVIVTMMIEVPLDWDEARIRAYMARQVLSSAAEKASLSVVIPAPDEVPAC